VSIIHYDRLAVSGHPASDTHAFVNPVALEGGFQFAQYHREHELARALVQKR